MPVDSENKSNAKERNDVGLVTIDHFHSVLVGYLMHWHRLSLDASFFFATASLTITAITLSAEHQTEERALLMAFLLLLISLAGVFVTNISMSHMSSIRNAIQQIDEDCGVFEPGRFIDQKTLYPSSWRVPANDRWSDPIKPIVVSATVLLPLLLAILVIATGYSLVEKFI